MTASRTRSPTLRWRRRKDRYEKTRSAYGAEWSRALRLADDAAEIEALRAEVERLRDEALLRQMWMPSHPSRRLRPLPRLRVEPV